MNNKQKQNLLGAITALQGEINKLQEHDLPFFDSFIRELEERRYYIQELYK